jgi:hypothetical protein
LASTQTGTLNNHNPSLIHFELLDSDRTFENYDYYSEIEAVENTDIKFEERVKKQVKLINYVNKMKDIALDTFREYIDSNNPTKSTCFTSTVFEVSINCTRGKIMNMKGKAKLVYVNQEHQKLKR